jgi:alpha-beta hydrolase superfamily lysophospholipase
MNDPNDTSISRRGVLASATVGAGVAALGGAPATAQTSAPRTFVLVHGAWHGGWCWRRVADLLEKQGHKVFTPTLTGVGERSHLMSKDINLDTHITDLVNVFKWEDLKDVCLVVHSYGGWPGSGAIEQVGDRISSIVWLDAFKPEDGQRGFDTANEFSRKALLAAVEKGEPGSFRSRKSARFARPGHDRTRLIRRKTRRLHDLGPAFELRVNAVAEGGAGLTAHLEALGLELGPDSGIGVRCDRRRFQAPDHIVRRA